MDYQIVADVLLGRCKQHEWAFCSITKYPEDDFMLIETTCAGCGVVVYGRLSKPEYMDMKFRLEEQYEQAEAHTPCDAEAARNGEQVASGEAKKVCDDGQGAHGESGGGSGSSAG